ncbi:unnamed protein product [Somion occarium]|uniref:AMP-dependent synthetase/ligase domain-containing protein n=1 Tax=Somion occarium TaxID=3059160 RepID=A0ABP1CML2_9APHY
MVYQTHLSLIAESAAKFASRPVFRVPELSANGEVDDWKIITYSQFASDVETYAKYWSRTLAGDSLPARSVVGLWLGGLTYRDAVHIYSVARAGYIPQLFSLRLPNPDVIFELLAKGNAKALIADASFEPILVNAPLSVHIASDVCVEDVLSVSLPPLVEATNGDDVVMVFHTSGSTSGSPKLVPCSFKWLDAMIAKAYHVGKPRNNLEQDCTVWMGSMSHIGQTCMLLGSLQHGSCTIQPTKIAFSSDELIDMITRCRLNRLNQFATFLAMHLRNSKQDTKLLNFLTGLDEVLYSGLALPREEEDWAYNNGIHLKNLFGSTECGAMMLSVGEQGDDARYLKPINGTSYGFFPIAPETQNINARLLELVILSESGDCPDPSLRAADGHFHTGDLFIEAAPGCYVSRGRDDDWIKSENSLRCDTKAIEDNVRATCGDLISECIVVGNGRPSPALFVEAKDDTSEEKLKKLILRRTRHFHSRRYLHERITSPEFIFVVPKNTLPRTATKGNIRRRAVEEAFREKLDAVYGMSF